MTNENDLSHPLLALAAALEALGVRWAIGGSIASGAHGEPRSTNDVDVIAELDERSARELVARLGEAFYADGDVAADAARRRSSFNVIHTVGFTKIDVFIPGRGPLGLGQLDRVRPLEILPGLRAFPVLAPEDVVLQKLRWYQLGGEVSDRQWRDIVQVLAKAATLDNVYLEAVATSEGLEALLTRARADAAT